NQDLKRVHGYLLFFLTTYPARSKMRSSSVWAMVILSARTSAGSFSQGGSFLLNCASVMASASCSRASLRIASHRSCVNTSKLIASVGFCAGIVTFMSLSADGGVQGGDLGMGQGVGTRRFVDHGSNLIPRYPPIMAQEVVCLLARRET